eukprot:1307858-Rhodomonas_salina.5
MPPFRANLPPFSTELPHVRAELSVVRRMATLLARNPAYCCDADVHDTLYGAELRVRQNASPHVAPQVRARYAPMHNNIVWVCPYAGSQALYGYARMHGAGHAPTPFLYKS